MPRSELALLRAADDLAPLIREHATEAESNRSLPRPVVDAMLSAGFFRMFVPRELGGLEVSPVEGFEVMERISTIDSAAGWNLQITTAGGGTIGALLPDQGAREVFSDPDTIVAGGFNPPGMAIPVEGGFRLSGRWPFASACQHATWFVNTALAIVDGQPQLGPDGQPALLALLYPPSEARIIETWDPLGMRGTGSHDIAAKDVFVPQHRVAILRPFDDVGPAYQGPLYRLGLMPTIMGNAVVALGIARAAIDDAVELAKVKVPAFQQTRPIDRGVVHAHLARAEAGLQAARAYFYGALEAAWDTAVAGGRPSMGQRMQAQLAAAHAAEASAAAVDHVHAAVGSSGVREADFRFARHFRDVHTITQHALCSPTRFESMGQVMLGIESDWPLFAL